MFNTTLNMRNPLTQAHQVRQLRFGNLQAHPDTLVGKIIKLNPDSEYCKEFYSDSEIQNNIYAVTKDNLGINQNDCFTRIISYINSEGIEKHGNAAAFILAGPEDVAKAKSLNLVVAPGVIARAKIEEERAKKDYRDIGENLYDRLKRYE